MQNPELDIKVKALVAEGKMVEAMQLVIKTLGCGLKEGKVEYQARRDTAAISVPVGDIAAFIRERIAH